MFKPGGVNGRRGTLQMQTGEPIKEALTGNGKKKSIAHINNMQSNKTNIIKHIA